MKTKLLALIMLIAVFLTGCSNMITIEDKQTSTIHIGEDATLKRFYYPEYEGNYYLVMKNNKGVLIDAGGDSSEILKYVKKNKIQVEAIILTHGHYDHVDIAEELKKKWNCKLVIHHNDRSIYRQTCSNEADLYIDKEETLTFADVPFQIIHTPGHTQGSISIQTGNVVFTGDTLFKENRGRTDLEGGSENDIFESLEKLALLDEALVVYPGHGEPTTIGYEKEHNPYINNDMEISE